MSARLPAVAGMFYPNEPSLLAKQVKEFMLSAKTKPSCVGVVSPHAGYGYSGLTAAFAINSLRPAKRFIILGPNHTGMGSEFSLMSGGEWATPLGSVKVDGRLAAELLRRTDIADDAGAHMAEHSIEVQLPFLQKRFNSNSFSFVPVCIMNTSYSDGFMDACVGIGEVIADIVKNSNSGDIGIIASSDFSHYVAPDTIGKREKSIVRAILEMDVSKFFDALSSGYAGGSAADAASSVCGYGPIAVLMAAAKKLDLKARDIDSSNSGGSKAVSYRAIGFE